MVRECVDTAGEMGLEVVKTTPNSLNTLLGHKYHQVKIQACGWKERHHALRDACVHLFSPTTNTWALLSKLEIWKYC